MREESALGCASLHSIMLYDALLYYNYTTLDTLGYLITYKSIFRKSSPWASPELSVLPPRPQNPKNPCSAHALLQSESSI